MSRQISSTITVDFASVLCCIDSSSTAPLLLIDLLAHSFSFLSHRSFAIASRVNRSWNRAAQLPSAASHEMMKITRDNSFHRIPSSSHIRHNLRSLDCASSGSDQALTILTKDMPRLKHFAFFTMVPK